MRSVEEGHGGGSVIAWACMAASGIRSLVFIDDVTDDRSSRVDFEVHRLSAQIQKVQMDNDP